MSSHGPESVKHQHRARDTASSRGFTIRPRPLIGDHHGRSPRPLADAPIGRATALGRRHVFPVGILALVLMGAAAWGAMEGQGGSSEAVPANPAGQPPGGKPDERPEMATPQPRPPRRDPGSRVDTRGEALFFSRNETPIRIACADCHLVTASDSPPPDDLIRPGHTVYDAAGRGNWWNGRITTDSGEAGEVCLKRFMGGTEMSGQMRTRLVEYMMSLGAPYSAQLVIRRMPPGLVEAASGDREKGADLFQRACEGCHPGGGAGLGPDLAKSRMTPTEIAGLIREGKDPMPFYQADILTNEEVAHVAAFTYGLQSTRAD